MAIVDDRGRMILVGIAVGVGIVTIGRELFAPLRGLARPMAKAALRSGIIAVDRGRLALARAAEEIEDIAAEIRDERGVVSR